MYELKFMIDLLLVAIFLLLVIGVVGIVLYKKLDNEFLTVYQKLKELQKSFDALNVSHEQLQVHHSVSCNAIKQALAFTEIVVRQRAIVSSTKHAAVSHTDLVELADALSTTKRILETF